MSAKAIAESRSLRFLSIIEVPLIQPSNTLVSKSYDEQSATHKNCGHDWAGEQFTGSDAAVGAGGHGRGAI